MKDEETRETLENQAREEVETHDEKAENPIISEAIAETPIIPEAHSKAVGLDNLNIFPDTLDIFPS